MVDRKLYIGLDLSLNHWGLVALNHTSVVFESYLTDKKKYMNIYSQVSLKDGCRDQFLHLPKKQGEDRDGYIARRRGNLIGTLRSNLKALCEDHYFNDVYVCLEGYAYSANTRSSYEIAEFIGCVKNWLYRYNVKLRIHDPLSVKMFATGGAKCLKKDMVLAAQDSGFKISDALIKKTTKTISIMKIKEEVEEYDGPGTDLADAYWLARMLRTEILVREGKIMLENLSDGKRRVFLRVSKAYPINLLDREFTCSI